MTKQQFQKELLEKIKPGTKPSDLKKRKIKPPKDEGYSSGEESINVSEKGIVNETIAGQTKSISTTPLPNNQDLKNQITSLQKQLQLYKDFREADVKVKEKLKEENEALKQTIQDLQNKQKNPVKTKETQTEKTFALKNYSCQICFTTRKAGIPSQFLRVKNFGGERNKKIWVCFLCRKQVVVIYDEEENWRNF